MSDQYKALLKIRRQRELTKTLRANKEKEQLLEAEARQQSAQTELEQFVDYKKSKQREIYNANTGVEINRATIERNQVTILRLNETTQAKKDAVSEAQESTDAQEQQFNQARQERLVESRGVQKFEHIVDENTVVERKLDIRKEELKAEDIPHSPATNNAENQAE